jgi:opacity protein-like surface antigen
MKKIITTIAAVLFTLSGNVMAEGMKIGIDYLMLGSEAESEDFDTSAVQLRLSNSISPNIGIEGVFAIGISDDTNDYYDPNDLGNFSITAELDNMLGVFAKFHGDLTPRFQVYGRLGLAMVEYNFDVDTQNFGSGSESYDDTGLAFGVGAGFNLNETTALVAEYTQWPDVDVEGIDIETDVISVGLQISL